MSFVSCCNTFYWTSWCNRGEQTLLGRKALLLPRNTAAAQPFSVFIIELVPAQGQQNTSGLQRTGKQGSTKEQ